MHIIDGKETRFAIETTFEPVLVNTAGESDAISFLKWLIVTNLISKCGFVNNLTLKPNSPGFSGSKS